MKLGVVCEGETDYLAIKYYVGEELLRKDINADFVLLQPPPDRTSGGGWANVIAWLEGNPPEAREIYFGSGLFAGDKNKANINAILIHLDTDILSEKSFENFLTARGYSLGAPVTVADKAKEVSDVLFYFSKIDEVRENLKDKYISLPIADSSEAWCVAVDDLFDGNPESLQGQDLINAFGAALARFSKIDAKPIYKRINKNLKSREAYCFGTKQKVERLGVCSLFGEVVTKLVAIK